MRIAFCFTIVTLSYCLTGFVRRLAIAGQILDIPNHRSSHQLPTPRGGGIAIVLSYYFGLAWSFYQGNLAGSAFFALFASGLIVAIMGFIDDRRPSSVRSRLFAYASAAALALWVLGSMPVLDLGVFKIQIPWLLNLFLLLYLLWMINLYNFMDGINGIATIETISCSLAMILVYYLVGRIDLALPLLALGSAAIGFLFWNFPRARIFMGDVGSSFLGLSLALFSILAAEAQAALFWSWLIMLGVFIVDATLTLLRRAMQAAKLHEAHRCHAYQNASRKYKSHSVVSISVAAINLIWLFPLAVLVGMEYLQGFLGLCIAYLPLIVLAICFNAGIAES